MDYQNKQMENEERTDFVGHAGCSRGRVQDVQNHQEEREAIQKRTFTRWINIHLKRCEPPMAIRDLFSDVQDGRILMALLEELSGCKMLYRFRPSSHRIFRLNNIAKVLNFLEDRNVKCKSIDASDVADGIPSAVLGLIWTIIVLFHIKKSTRNIRHILTTNSGSVNSIDASRDASATNNNLNSNTFPSKRRKTSKYRGTAIKTLLRWAQMCTSKYDIEVRNFGRSWRSGLAFLALIKSINPALVDMRTALTKTPQENVGEAFRIAHDILGIPPLLDLADVTTKTPDEQSIITYVTQFLEYRQNLDKVNGVEPYPRSYDTSANSPDSLCSPSSDLEKYPSTTESIPCTSEKSTDSTVESSNKPNDVFETCSTEGQSFGCSFSVKGTGGQACAECFVDTLSLSSEEGVYTLSALDSEEEEAYRYILALDEDTKEDSRPDSGFQPVITSNNHHPIVSMCQCKEEVSSKNRNNCIFGYEQIALVEPNGEVAFGENRHADLDASLSAPPIEDKLGGQNMSIELITTEENTSGANRAECSKEDSHTAGETFQKRQDIPSKKTDNEIKERLCAELESHDPGDDTLDTKDLCDNDVTNVSHTTEGDCTLDRPESHQTDNCTLSYTDTDHNGDTDASGATNANGDTDSNGATTNGDTDGNTGHTSQTQGECLLEKGFDRGKDMCDIQGMNGQPLESKTRMDHGIEREEDLNGWDGCNLLSNKDITQVNTDPTREGTFVPGNMETCCGIDTEELHLLLWLWIVTYCFFIILQLDICQYVSDLLKQ